MSRHRRVAVISGLCIAILGIVGIAIQLFIRVGELQQRVVELERLQLVRAEIAVTGIDNSLGRPGQYFLFNPSGLDATFGRGRWTGRIFLALFPERGSIEQVRLWAGRAGSAGSYGRLEKESPSHQWQEGEILFVIGASN